MEGPQNPSRLWDQLGPRSPGTPRGAEHTTKASKKDLFTGGQKRPGTSQHYTPCLQQDSASQKATEGRSTEKEQKSRRDHHLERTEENKHVPKQSVRGAPKGSQGPPSTKHQHLNTQIVRFLFIQHCCLFVFFCISAECPSRFFFVKYVATLATTSPVKETFWSRKGGFNWTKNNGDAHPYDSFRVLPPSCVELACVVVAYQWHATVRGTPAASQNTDSHRLE